MALFPWVQSNLYAIFHFSMCNLWEKKWTETVSDRSTDRRRAAKQYALPSLKGGGGHIKVPLLLHVGDICCRTNRNTLFSLMIYTKYIFSADASEELQTTLDLCFRDGSLSCQLLIQTLDIKVISRKYRTDESGNHLTNPNW